MPTIPYVKQTWTDGSSSCSAARNNVHEDGIFAAHYMPTVRVFHNANQAIVTATVTALAFNSERYDQAANTNDTQHDTVTNNSRLTCKYAGVYTIGASVAWEVVAAGTYRQTALRVNGTTVIGYQTSLASTSSGQVKQSLSVDYSLAVNDYVEVVVDHDRGSNLNVLTAGNYSPEFWMHRVG